MARDYRSETVAAIYQVISAHAPLDATFPNRRLLKNDEKGRKKGLYFRQSSDFPYLQIVIGDSDSGTLFGASTFADEEDGVPYDVSRSADVTLKFLYDGRQDDDERSAMETACLAAIADKGRDLVPGILSATFRRRTGAAQVDNKPDVKFGTTLTITFNFTLDPEEVLP